MRTSQPPAELADALLDATDLTEIEEVVRAELSRWDGVDLHWCRLTPLVPAEPQATDRAAVTSSVAVDRDLRRILSRFEATEGRVVRMSLRRGEAVAVSCGGGTDLVLVAAASQLPAGTTAAIEPLAALVGVVVRQLGQRAQLDERRRTARFEELVRFSSDAIFITDATGTIRYAAPSVTTVLGVWSTEVENRHLSELVVPEQHGDVLTFLGNVQLQDPRDPSSVSLRFRRGDGSTIHGEITGSNLLGNDEIRGLVLTVRDVSARVELEEQLRHQAFHDGLTGLANRALFRDRLERAMKVRRDRADAAPVVAYIDLDDFKDINDRHGHAAGDEVLCAIAGRIQACLRGSDTAARLGGDEFALLIEEIGDRESVAQLVQRVVDAVSEPIMVGDDLVIHASVSSGVATANVEVNDAEDLLRHADMAMYRAKLLGKAQVAVFEAEMRDDAHDRIALTGELDAAIDRGDLELHYQPIVEIETERIVAVEALVRWPHPRRGLLGPGEFIEVAEESGLIVPLGAHVLAVGLADLAGWRSTGVSDLALSVNVSPRQFLHEDFERDVLAALETAGLDAGCLLLEITEATLAGGDAAADRVRRLSALGIRFAIDDFGTGQSSLQALHELPINQLKIDRAFVSPYRHESEVDLARLVVEIADGVGAVAVAEGIERPEELEVIQRIGCVLAQGNHFGPAGPAGTILPMLMTERSRPSTSALR